MASISNRSAWGVFSDASKKPLGEFPSEKKAQSFADECVESGLVENPEVRQLVSGPWHVRIRNQGFPLVVGTFKTKREANVLAPTSA